MDEKTIARFWSKVDKDGPVQSHMPHLGQCWIWIGTAKSGWYGHFSVNKVRYYSHRISYELAFGELPDGMCVCHKCDTPSCVNPFHLFLGTDADNATDKSKKGRAKWGPDHKFRIHPELIPSGQIISERNRKHGLIRNLGPARRGVEHAQSKLTELDVVEIVRLRIAGVGTQKLADMYGVSRSLIHQTLRGDTWKHIPRKHLRGRRSSDQLDTPALNLCPLIEQPLNSSEG